MTQVVASKERDNLCKQFGPISGPINVGPDLDPNLIDTLMVFL